MPRLPSSANVPVVGPPRALSVGAPVAAFGSPQAEAVANAGNVAMQVVDQRLSRIEALNHARAENELIQRGQDKLIELRDTSDTFGQDQLAEYDEWLAQQRQELMGKYGGRSRQQAYLAQNLENLSARYRGKASALADEVALDNLNQAMSGTLDTYKRTASADPSRIPDVLNEWRSKITNVYAQGMPPGMDRAALQAGSEEIIKSSLRPFLVSGDVQGARDLLDTYGGLYLPQDSVAELNGYITEQAQEADEFSRKLQFLQENGVPITPDVLREIVNANPDQPLVQIGGGAAAPIMGDIPKEMVAIPDPSQPAGYRLEPMKGGSVDQERNAAAQAGQLSTELAQDQLQNTALYGVNRIMDIIEESGGGTGPVEGLAGLGGWNPLAASSRIEPFLAPIRSMVVRDTMENMRASSPAGASGFGAMSERELSVVEAAQGALDTSMEEKDLFRTLETIVEGQAKAAFGTDTEIEAAVSDGRITGAQASAMRQSRNQVINDFKRRSENILKALDQGPPAPAASPQFDVMLNAIRSDPFSVTPEQIAGMDLDRSQLVGLAEAYDAAIAQAPPELVDFVGRNPGARRYAMQMADLLESGEAQTLDEAYQKARGGGR